MNAHLPMLLTITSMLLLTLAVVCGALAVAVYQGALESRVRIDADVRILAPVSRVVPGIVTTPYSVRTAILMLNRQFDAVIADLDTYDQARAFARRYNERRVMS